MSTFVYVSIVFLILGVSILFLIIEKLSTRYRDMFIEVKVNASIQAVKEAEKKFDFYSGLKKNPTENPDVYVFKMDSGSVEMIRVREFEPGTENRLVRRIEAIKYRHDEREVLFPYGDESFSVEEFLFVEDDKTLYKYSAHEKLSIISYYIRKYRIKSQVMIKVRDMAEGRAALPSSMSENSGQVSTSGKPEPAPEAASVKNIWQICSTIVALAVAIWQFGLLVGVGIVLAVVVHEFGHAIGFRLVGERVRGIHLIPFLGGVTIGTPPRTVLRSVIVFLSGTTFSFFVAAFIFCIAYIYNWFFPVEYDEIYYNYSESLAGVLNIIVFIILMLNIVQLAPVPLLDGGRTASAMFSCFPWQIGVIVISFAGFFIAAYLYRADYTFDAAMIWLFSLWNFSQLLYPRRRQTFYKPATYKQALGIAALYILHAAAYVAAIVSLTVYIMAYVPGVKRIVDEYKQQYLEETDDE